MSAGLKIVDFNPATNKFIVSAPPWEVERCRGIPNRRWNKGNKTWVAPYLLRNIEYLETAFADAVWTDIARRACVEKRDSRKINRLPFPSWYAFKREPRIKQREAINRAYNMREFGFIMDPGTGKSQAIVDWCTAYAMEGRINAVLVIVPNSVTYNWIDELKDTCPIEYVADVMDGGSYKVAKAMTALQGKFKWLIMSWESLSQGKAKSFALEFVRTSKCAVIRDESSWGKNHKSVRTDAATELGNAAEYRAIATGTVVLKHITDLYSQLEMMSTDIVGIGDFYSFRNRYCVMGGYENKEVEGYKNVDELMELISPYVYVAYKRECIDIPPKTPENSPPGILRRVQLTDEQLALYKAIRSKYAQPEFQGLKVPTEMTLEVKLRCRQVCQGIISVDTERKDKDGNAILEQRYILPPAKNPKIIEMMRYLEETDEQTIVWTPFTLDVEAITAALRLVYGYEAVLNLPKGDPKLLQEETRAFRAGKYRFCVSTQQLGGIGLNLQSASLEIFMANTENFADRIQAEGRFERDGQKNAMTVIDIVADNTVDTKTIIPSLVEKLNLADYVKARLHAGSRLIDMV